MNAKSIVAVLANAQLRLLYATIVVDADKGEPVTVRGLNSKRRRHARTLESTGLIASDDGILTPTSKDLDGLLESESAPDRADPSRFLIKGRLEAMPRRFHDRVAVLTLIAEHTLDAGEVVSEKEFTKRLAALANDPVNLRRDLVDFQLVTRTPDGAEYRRIPA